MTFSFHSQPADPAASRCGGISASENARSTLVQGQPEAPRLSLANGHRTRPQPRYRTYQWDEIRRRDREGGLYISELCPADRSAVLFGLSGTGKTTFSTDSDRALIGNDEQSWDETVLFDFEGGCYAKAIALSAELEPKLHTVSRRFNLVMENVGMDTATRRIDFVAASKTEKTRIA